MELTSFDVIINELYRRKDEIEDEMLKCKFYNFFKTWNLSSQLIEVQTVIKHIESNFKLCMGCHLATPKSRPTCQLCGRVNHEVNGN